MRCSTLFLLLFVCLSAQQLSAQEEKHKSTYFELDDMEGTGRIGFHAEGYRTFFPNYKYPSFDRFRESYNTVNKNLTSPMGGLQPKGGWVFGLGAHASVQTDDGMRGSYYLSVNFSKLEATATATTNTGDQREMKVIMKPIDVNFDILVGIGKRVEVGMALGAEFQNCTLYSGYKYKYGVLSYGEDQALNGIYRYRGNLALNWGARMDIKIIRQLRFSVRAEYCGVFQSLYTTAVSPNTDELYNNAYSAIYTDGFSHNYLTEDVKNANNSDAYYVGILPCLYGTFKGWRITTGLILDLKTWEF